MDNKDLQEEFEELMGPYLYGESSPEETKRLIEITESEPALKRRYENYVKMQSGLKSHSRSLKQNPSSYSTETLEIEETGETGKPEKENPFLKPIYGFLALAAGLLIVFGLYRFNSDKGTRSDFSVHTLGNCDFQSLESGSVSIGERQFCDWGYRSPIGSINFRIFENSKVQILSLPKSETAHGIVSVFLIKGKILVKESVDSENKTSLYVDGKKIQLLGTKVLLEKENGKFSLSVWEGSVKVRSGVEYLLPFLSEKNSFEKMLSDIDPNQARVLRETAFETVLSGSKLEGDSGQDVSETLPTLSSVLKDSALREKTIERLKEIGRNLQKDSASLRKKELDPAESDFLEKESEHLGSEHEVRVPTYRNSDDGKAAEPTISAPKKKSENDSEAKDENRNPNSSEKTEPIRLGNKTVRLKDGTELKGNLIQYENRYTIESQGKKRTLRSEEVESISF
ncbi:hypothetical protein EHQ12_04920 [Leptospira gomenensis]|uniref:FecR protein domain-containing protein n=1 Tax=Leptospira gomenensis TaxID=2484974 RepID=A0A5F1YFR9_9LEPT|nr:FecR domain-containing protein [Leptospira gomenensis]TGK39239.1 hypothetical protein EHQ17_00285 [Leptospira gomenensis]TGK42547.1 hypothetical protein EHQ12_04920 [Leptospira gomenensis]TGK48909.1 hypothetical protein EHQ07_05035 [Leptospira gomenensis]TGK54619.1 hypothetical protein EHQ13_19005 [Leptospira gomenensis]